ncbi:4-hydroxy-tetrahydrodipicolinate synthase [Leptolyngbya cf. ectocarpi LEGE 11479]|uniref:4-hydroxy-tetrahydrodipicolinate synthase n=1 Tax=Leptolyngbya cf. ectocarpi LEGE 11479 TaxID=1828722 RepID=A0A928WZI2_LEPEC|nr:4-hydroxy-tetrahydrodipicolinate synthase [Leptolyngbya ectocarpi]MBE9066187.1 4-hydroxy-tetrahydrodipicolinate synthase [Leptolyngbya cf. ectocarpi LEGE 11479]
MTYFGRVLTAMITPFDQSGAVDYESARRLASHLVSHGTDTVVVCGTTGESPTLSWSEEYELFQVVKAAVSGRGKVVAGTGSNSTREAIAATQKAAELGLDGTLQVVPYYNKPPQAGLQAHFSAIAKAVSDLPVMLYNVPGRTGQNLEAPTVAKLAEIPNIIAIKAASGNLDQVSEIRRLTPSDFDIYSGDDSLTLPMLAVGAVGVVSVASHLVGESLQQMIQSYETGQVLVARDIHLKLLPLCKALFATTNPILIKAALDLQGWSVGVCRLPLSTAPVALIDELQGLMAELELLPTAVV